MEQSNSPKAPEWVQRFVEWFCPDELVESILGDLLEEFDHYAQRMSARKARRRFFWKSLLFFRPYILMRNKIAMKNPTLLLSNYTKIAWRNILKRKMYAFLNAFGLSIGIAISILIYLFIIDEYRFDRFHTKSEQIFRLNERSYDSDLAQNPEAESPYRESAYLPLGIGSVIKDEIPAVRHATRFVPIENVSVGYGTNIFKENGAFVDADFFQMFDFQFIKGSANQLFLSPLEIVLTSETAKKYFGEEDPIGKTLKIEGSYDFTVMGIIENPPAYSSLNFSMLAPIQAHPKYQESLESWGNFSFPTFVELNSEASLSGFKNNLNTLVNKYLGDRMERWRERYKIPKNDTVFEITFTSLQDIHHNYKIEWYKATNPQTIFILGGVALLILVIACINYVSLATMLSAQRNREVGVRKVLGASKKGLIGQFWVEAMMTTAIAAVFGLGLAYFFTDRFNDFTGKNLSLFDVNPLYIFLFIVILIFIIGTFSGLYPAIIASRFNPIRTLRIGLAASVSSAFSKPLVVLQFSLSAFLIISAIVMVQQMNYITHKELGFDQSQIVVLKWYEQSNIEGNSIIERIRQATASSRHISSVTGAGDSFARSRSRYGYRYQGEQHHSHVFVVDPYYLPTLSIKLKEGRNFRNTPADAQSVIVNEALLRDIQMTDPIGKRLTWTNDSLGYEIIGVVEDYYFLSLEEEVQPMLLTINQAETVPLSYALVKVDGQHIPEAIADLKSVWRTLAPDKPFDYSFLDEDIAVQYESYQRWMRMMLLSAGIAILIACLGLFGLAGITTLNKTKEIGIRKIFGANAAVIFIMLNKRYLILASIAYLLAIPFSIYVIQKWLSNFHYAIDINWWWLVAILILLNLIATIAVGYHSINAARMNPVKSLKYE